MIQFFFGKWSEHKINIYVLLIVALAANIFFYHAVGPVGFSLFILMLYFLVQFLFRTQIKKFKLTRTTTTLTGLLLIFLGLLVLCGNGFIQMLSVLSSLILFGVTVYLLSSGSPNVRSVFEFIFIPLKLFAEYLISAVRGIEKIISLPQKNTPHIKGFRTYFRPIIVAILVGVPLLWTITALLMSGDPIFATFIKNIHLPTISPELVGRAALTIFLFGIFFPYIFFRMSPLSFYPLHIIKKFHFRNEMMIIVGLVSVILGLFLVIQWPYVFANVAFETDLSKFGVATYSEYVRRGFGEFLLITCIVYVLLWAVHLVTRGLDKAEKLPVYGFTSILITELVIFIISIGRRVLLYQQFHGWSLVRIYGLWFLGWIVFLILTLIAREVKKIRWITIELGVTVLFIVGLGLFKTENFIVHTHPPTVNHRVDYMYLSRLSTDGYDGWVKAFHFASSTLSLQNYAHLTLISVDGRRDIAYAGGITRALTDEYRRLVMEYGSGDEKKQYLTLLLSSVKDGYVSHLTLMKSQLTDQGISKKPNFSSDSIRQDISDTQKIIEMLTKMEKDLQKNNISPERINSQITWNYRIPYPTYGEGYYNEPYYLGQQNNFYELKKTDKNVREPGFLDKLYKWNYSQYQAYKNIKHDMPFEVLLKLQKQYFSLYEKIQKQPQKERSFKSDISFDTPFLSD